MGSGCQGIISLRALKTVPLKARLNGGGRHRLSGKVVVVVVEQLWVIVYNGNKPFTGTPLRGDARRIYCNQDIFKAIRSYLRKALYEDCRPSWNL